jgi:hypothetical protein
MHASEEVTLGPERAGVPDTASGHAHQHRALTPSAIMQPVGSFPRIKHDPFGSLLRGKEQRHPEALTAQGGAQGPESRYTPPAIGKPEGPES